MKVLLAVVFLACCSCSSLSAQGKGVQLTRTAADVKGCTLVGGVSADPPFAMPNDWEIKLRNEAGEKGGNRVLTDGPGVGSVHGDAYSCSAPR